MSDKKEQAKKAREEKQKIKKEKENEERKRLEEAQEQLRNLINQVQEEVGTDEKVRVIKIPIPKRNFKSSLYEVIITLLLNTSILLAITGYIEWCKYDTLLDLIIFIGVFTLIELIIYFLIIIKYPQLIIRTLNLIMIIPSLIGVVSALLIVNLIEITKVTTVFIVFLLFFSVRKFIKNTIFEFMIKSKLKGKKNARENNNK